MFTYVPFNITNNYFCYLVCKYHFKCKSIFWIKTLEDAQKAIDKINNGFKPEKSDVEHYAAGKDTEVDISGYDRTTMDRFDYSQLPKGMVNPIRSLVKHMDMFFASPTLNAKLEGIIPKSRGEVKTVIGKDGQKIPIRRSPPKKGEFWNLQTDQTGEGC